MLHSLFQKLMFKHNNPVSSALCPCGCAATLDGGLGLLLPMQEKTYRRLLMLQNALNTMLPHHAGLNPKAFRYPHTCKQRVIWLYHSYPKHYRV